MTRAKTLWMNSFFCFLLFWISLPAWAEVSIQEADLQAISEEQLAELLQSVHEATQRITALVDDVNVTPAQEWLAAHGRQHLEERVQASSSRPSEQALWQGALDHLTAGHDRINAALERANQAFTARERLQRAEQWILEVMAAKGGAREPATTRSLSQIEEEIATLERRRTQFNLEIEQKRQTLTRIEDRLRSQQEMLERSRESSTDTDATLPIVLTQLDDLALSEAYDAWERARDAREEARVIGIVLENKAAVPRMEVLRLELRVLTVMNQWLGSNLLGLQGELESRADDNLRNMRQEIRLFRDSTPGLSDADKLKLDSLLTRIDTIAQVQGRVRSVRANQGRYEVLEQDLQQSLASVQERLEVGGLTEALGRLLLQEQRRLRNLQDLGRVSRELERELTQSRLRDIALRDDLRIAEADSRTRTDRASPQARLAALHLEVLETQLAIEEQLTEVLIGAELLMARLVALIDEVTQLLQRSLLWWPSHPPVGPEWILTTPAAVLSLLEPSGWRPIPLALHQISVESPALLALTLLITGILYLWARKTPGQLAHLAEKTRHRYTDRIGLTFQALAWSVLRALPIPVLFGVTAFRLSAIPDSAVMVETFAISLYGLGFYWFAAHLTLILTGRNGVGPVHFEWNPVLLRRLRRHMVWFLPTQLLLLLFLVVAFGHPSDLVTDVFARVGLLTAIVVTAFFALSLLAPLPASAENPASTSARSNTPAGKDTKSGAPAGKDSKSNAAASKDSKANPPASSDHHRRYTRIGVAIVALTLLGLTLAGYLLTVVTLLGLIFNSIMVIGAVWLGYSLGARALVLTETKLQLRQMREQRAKAAALEGSVNAGEGAPIDIPEPHLSIENINQQTRTLMRVSAGAGLVLGLLWVWADTLPALTWLDGITLWSRTIAVGEAEILSRVSLQDFLLAIFLGVIFTLAARNLPGLVEIVLSRSALMDAAGRYTVTTLLRYALAVVAVISVFSLLGLRWSELQWMVAALTLGLGFGLQEVVANFVSGVIMLFERPVRVGDTITIGEFSGTVTRIRTRATTIVDWDNREIMIPNKNFITERLINWTLSDTMTRIVIPVGVSYDADVDVVMETLNRVANEHPAVLGEPAPSVLFVKFGDSALNFELRIYVNQLKDRMSTLSELHRTIILEFRRLGVEIAYPQLDVHVRDIAPMARGAESIAPTQGVTGLSGRDGLPVGVPQQS